MVTARTANDTGTLLAELFAYPHDDCRRRLQDARNHLAENAPDAAAHLAEFAAAIEPLALSEHEELFTRTFDVNPVGALEIGWHLFGEDYHRGALLARLRVELRRHAIPEATELPDHLTHVLLLLDRMATEEAEEFALACVLPALDKMLEGFRGKANPYEHLLRCVESVLLGRFGAADSRGPDPDRTATSTARPARVEDPFRPELLRILDDGRSSTSLAGSCAGCAAPASGISEEGQS